MFVSCTLYLYQGAIRATITIYYHNNYYYTIVPTTSELRLPHYLFSGSLAITIAGSILGVYVDLLFLRYIHLLLFDTLLFFFFCLSFLYFCSTYTFLSARLRFECIRIHLCYKYALFLPAFFPSILLDESCDVCSPYVCRS